MVRKLRERLGVERLAVGEGLRKGTGMIQVCRVGKVLAPGDGHGAEPVLVGLGAVLAGADEGVPLRVGRFAGDLGEVLFEVGVDVFGVVVVEGGEFARVAEVGIAGD